MRCRSILAAVFSLAAAAPLAAYPRDEGAPKDAVVGRLAPEFDVREWIGGDGRTSLADFRGELVLLEFWGTH